MADSKLTACAEWASGASTHVALQCSMSSGKHPTCTLEKPGLKAHCNEKVASLHNTCMHALHDTQHPIPKVQSCNFPPQKADEAVPSLTVCRFRKYIQDLWHTLHVTCKTHRKTGDVCTYESD